MADTRPLHSQPADHAQWQREFENESRLRGDRLSASHGETFHLTPLSKIVLGLLWLVLAALIGTMLSIQIRMNEKQSDWNGTLSGALVEIRQAREDTNRVERNQEGIHNHVVSVDAYTHDNVARLDRRIDEVERSRSRK